MIKVSWVENGKVESKILGSMSEAERFTAELEKRGVVRFKVLKKSGPAFVEE